MIPNKEELGSNEESDDKKESNDFEASIGLLKSQTVLMRYEFKQKNGANRSDG
jgi:hypothetical protein